MLLPEVRVLQDSQPGRTTASGQGMGRSFEWYSRSCWRAIAVHPAQYKREGTATERFGSRLTWWSR
jgi:hypothetical protein